MGDHERATTYCDGSLEIRREAMEPNHPLVIGTLSERGRCLTELNRYVEAEISLVQAFEGMESGAEVQEELRDVLLDRLEWLFRATGRPGEAERYASMREPPMQGVAPQCKLAMKDPERTERCLTMDSRFG